MFSQTAIVSFFEHLREEYETHRLRDWQSGPGVILRQDVDLDLRGAEVLMELQHQVGLRSSFFVLLTSPTYNPHSAESRRILTRMVEMGFEVGLHFDPTVDEQGDRLTREAETLSRLCGENVVSVSLHNPTSRGEFPLYDGFINAYDPAIFEPESYLSDSLCRFRHEPREFLKRAKNRVVQLLLHPCHYGLAGGYQESFQRHIDHYLDQVDRSFRPFNPTFAQQIQPDLKEWYLAQADGRRSLRNERERR